MQNKAVYYFHFAFFIFENKVAGDKMQLDNQFARYLASVECPVSLSMGDFPKNEDFSFSENNLNIK